MFLLLAGVGVGYSVQSHHVAMLPEIKRASKSKKYVIGDNIEGWADAIKVLMKSYFGLSSWTPKFDYSAIRAKGERLITSGGVAPGPEPLKICIAHIQAILDRYSDGEKLSTLSCHDILCHIANAVLSGGIRRSAMISLFDADDNDMMTCKFGKWYETNPQRGRSNNSAVMVRSEISREQFFDIWSKVEASQSGEPGMYLTDNKELGTNPCCFTGDMKLLTANGYRTFEELVDEEVCALINKNGEIVEGRVWFNGIKDVVKLRLSDDSQIKCTPDHVLMTVDGTEFEAGRTQGKRLMPYYKPNLEINEYVKYGFIQGDGYTGRLGNNSHKGIEVYFGEKDSDVAEIFGFLGYGTKYVGGFNEVLSLLGMDTRNLPQRCLPTGFESLSKENKKSFLKGMYSANGSVIKSSRISYKTTCNKLAKQLVCVLYGFGLSPYVTTNKEKEVEFSNGNYICKESYDVNIGRYNDIVWFFENIGFIQKYKIESLHNLIKNRAPKVLSITNAGIQNVYDFNLQDETHWGVVEGIIAHNCEISLNPFQFCNLVEINASDIKDQSDLMNRTWAASVIGTIQASYTDFHYLRKIWQETTEKEALLGIGMTGIASGIVDKLNLDEAAKYAIDVNIEMASRLKINPAARVTCVKPSGTTSLVLGTSSGIHAWHSDYYIRRVRVGKNEAMYTYLSINNPDMIEDDLIQTETQAVLSVPQKAPDGAITREREDAISFLERIKMFHEKWIKPGHVYGDNTHNVSATVTIKDEEWGKVGQWLWDNKNSYNGLSFLPESLGSYKQTPFESIDKETYESMIGGLHSIDVTKIVEIGDNTNLADQVACAGGLCEVV